MSSSGLARYGGKEVHLIAPIWRKRSKTRIDSRKKPDRLSRGRDQRTRKSAQLRPSLQTNFVTWPPNICHFIYSQSRVGFCISKVPLPLSLVSRPAELPSSLFLLFSWRVSVLAFQDDYLTNGQSNVMVTYMGSFL